jgi:hypothetical protein
MRVQQVQMSWWVPGGYYRRSRRGDAEDKMIAFLQSMVKLEKLIDFWCTDINGKGTAARTRCRWDIRCL